MAVELNNNIIDQLVRRKKIKKLTKRKFITAQIYR